MKYHCKSNCVKFQTKSEISGENRVVTGNSGSDKAAASKLYVAKQRGIYQITNSSVMKKMKYPPPKRKTAAAITATAALISAMSLCGFLSVSNDKTSYTNEQKTLLSNIISCNMLILS